VEARLDALGPEAKRILRAASVFGEVFWEGGVRALNGEREVPHPPEWLDHLIAREVLVRQPEARIPGEREYAFRHALVRDAAYAMLTEQDRSLGHRLAGEWLERAGSVDALTLAEHFVRGEDPARAIGWFTRAANQALEGNDLGSAQERAERAVAAGARGEALGALRLIQATAAFWQSAYAEAQRHGGEAASLLPRGSGDYFRALGATLVADATLGDTAAVDRRLAEAASTAALPGGESAQLICLSRGCFQLLFAGRFAAADAIVERISELAGSPPELSLRAPPEPSALPRFDAMAVAQVHHVLGMRAAHLGDIPGFARHLELAVAAFERAGDRRNALTERTTIAGCYDGLGDYERAERIARANLAESERAGVQRAAAYARSGLGMILVQQDAKREAGIQLLRQVIDELRATGNRRYEGVSRAELALALHFTGDGAASEAEARRALELLDAAPSFRARALAVLARALLGLGRAEEALDAAREAHRILDELGGVLLGESLPPLVLAEALAATGDTEGAFAAIQHARARLLRRAEHIADPDLRRMFFATRDNARTLALAEAWTSPA
jgi:tetratricopeptide (TPR) repeat protein